MLAIGYVLIFLLELAGLVRAFRLRRGFGLLVFLDLGIAAAALAAMKYFDQLSARNTAAGWAYFPEAFSSLCAAVGFGLLGLITAAVWLLRKK